MRSLGERIRYSDRIHRTRETNILPDFMLALFELPNLEDRETVASAMLAYLDILYQVNPVGTILSRFKSSLRNKTYSPQGASITLKRYLDHRADCPSETEASQVSANTLRTLFNDLTSDRSVREDRGLLESDILVILRDPIHYLLELSEQRARTSDNSLLYRGFSKFIESSFPNIEALASTAIQENLNSALPEVITTINQFRDWFNDGRPEIDKYQKVIQSSARDLVFGHSDFRLENLYQIIGRHINPSTSLRGDRPYDISTNHHLRLVLPILVMQEAMLQIESGKVPILSAKAEDEMPNDRLQRVFDEYRSSLTKNIEFYEEAVARVSKKFEKINHLMSTYQITARELDDLINVAEAATPKSPFAPKIDPNLLCSLLAALILEKSGHEGAQTNAFKNFVQAIFPNAPIFQLTLI